MSALASDAVGVDGGARPGAAPARGVVRRGAGDGAASMPYLLHRSPGDTEGASVVVAVHGISRNAVEQAESFGPIAARYGLVVVAPYFSRRACPAFQRLGFARAGRVSAPDLALIRILEDVRCETGADVDRVFLFGFSGGGQFAHRFAMRHPDRVSRVVLGAPGWYTFPDPGEPYPRGLAGSPGLEAARFLQVPMAVLVGNRDRERDDSLNRSRRVDAQQGINRVERGQRWIAAMRAAARARGYDTEYRFERLRGCGHSFSACVRRGDLVRRSLEFFFDGRTAAMDHAGSGWVLFQAG